MPFQPGFLWGAGSAAYQVEGAWNEHGKGDSIWDAFCHTPDHINNAEDGDMAANAYHLFETDLAIMRELELSCYRFSISWPRILPEGRGTVNQKGLDYYDRVVDSLLSSGITPFVTLYHWDLPLALEQSGGWENRATAEAFMEYAELIAKHFDGRVTNYVTLNEPQCFLGLGYHTGIHAPGKRLSTQALTTCAHHALIAHGGAVAAMRAVSRSPLTLGLASTGKICYPMHDATDTHAAYDATFALHEDDWTFSHAWLLDAAVLGRYPNGFAPFSAFNETVSEADFRIIRQRSDFIGLNIYNGTPVGADGQRIRKLPGFPRTALKWPVTPECMYYGSKFLYERYALPLFITENGQSCNDRIYLDGNVHDIDRIDFLTRYLRQLKRSIDEGIPVHGYCHWSLTDNFEWHSGYDERFGLVYIDYPTQKRTIKDSGYWYRNVIRSNGHV